MKFFPLSIFSLFLIDASALAARADASSTASAVNSGIVHEDLSTSAHTFKKKWHHHKKHARKNKKKCGWGHKYHQYCYWKPVEYCKYHKYGKHSGCKEYDTKHIEVCSFYKKKKNCNRHRKFNKWIPSVKSVDLSVTDRLKETPPR